MPLWNLPEDDFLSKRRANKGGASYPKRKASTSRKATVKKSGKAPQQYASVPVSQKVRKNSVEGKRRARAREEERKASTIKNACIALVCLFFIVVFFSDFKGCSSSKRSASFELPAFDLSSVIDSIGDVISDALSGSYSDSYSSYSIKYIKDIDLKSDIYMIQNNSSTATGITIVCLYQTPVLENDDDYIYSYSNSKLMYRDGATESYSRCFYSSLIGDYSTFYQTSDKSVQRVVEINSAGWHRKDNNKPFISVEYTSAEGAKGLDPTKQGREYAVIIGDENGEDYRTFNNVVVHNATYAEVDEIIKGWVKEFGLDEKSKYETYETY